MDKARRRDCPSYAERLGYRLAVLSLSLALIAVSACGGDDDSGTAITGQYDLTRVDGQDLPTSGEELGSEFTFSGGSITLDEDGRWTMSIEIEESTDAHNDAGSYTEEDGSIEFTSTTFGDAFSGTVDDGTLEIDYDFDGEAGVGSELTFE